MSISLPRDPLKCVGGKPQITALAPYRRMSCYVVLSASKSTESCRRNTRQHVFGPSRFGYTTIILAMFRSSQNRATNLLTAVLKLISCIAAGQQYGS